ncbi:MAG: HAD family hydrolase [Chloroflexota bacterium]|nr:MAG: HAD family hydrolase [Chloroflexota bacterium]
MGRWNAIVFDLDDTLYPERDYVLGGMKAVASWAEAELGIPSSHGFAELTELFEHGVRGVTFNRWLGSHGFLDETLIASAVHAYRAHRPVLRPFREVPALLTSLKREHQLGLLTDGYVEVQRGKLEALRLTPYFDAIVLSDELGRDAWKPSPKPFLALLERLGGPAPEYVVYVADNPSKDFLGARTAGLASIRVRRPGGEYSTLQPLTDAHRPDATIASLGSLEGALLELPAPAAEGWGAEA